MLVYLEKYFPHDLEPGDSAERSFVRLNLFNPEEVTDFLRLGKVSLNIPVLCAPKRSISVYDYDDLIRAHIEAAERLREASFLEIAVAADDDGVWQQRLSPRFSELDIHGRMKPFINLFQALSAIMDEVWVMLTLEELAPGGLDATDGLAILQALEASGLKQVIIASGTRDFMPLFHRRVTQKKGPEMADFNSHEPELASAGWAVLHTKLKVWSLASMHDPTSAEALARNIGLHGLVKRATLLNI